MDIQSFASGPVNVNIKKNLRKNIRRALSSMDRQETRSRPRHNANVLLILTGWFVLYGPGLFAYGSIIYCKHLDLGDDGDLHGIWTFFCLIFRVSRKQERQKSRPFLARSSRHELIQHNTWCQVEKKARRQFCGEDGSVWGRLEMKPRSRVVFPKQRT